MTTRVAAATALAMVVILASVGCSRDRPDLDGRISEYLKGLSIEDRQHGHDERAKVLADGVVTDAEIDEMFAGFRECMASAGQEVVGVMRSPLDGRSWLFDIGNLDELDASDSDANHECVTRFSMDAAVSQVPGRMDEPLRRSVQACLADAGITVSEDDRDLRALAKAVGRNQAEALRSCIGDGMEAGYPPVILQVLLPEVL